MVWGLLFSLIPGSTSHLAPGHCMGIWCMFQYHGDLYFWTFIGDECQN